MIPGELVAIAGIIAGTVITGMMMFPIYQWIRYRHELNKKKLEQSARPPEEPEKVRKLEERLINLENLICRLDSEMNYQLERSMGSGKVATLSGAAGVSQMPTTFLTVASALEGRYQILKELGRGGMGVVFQAHDKQLNEQVALKIISPLLSNDEEALERLKREVSSARKISHPNIIRIYDISENNGLHFVSMEYFLGQSLKEFIRQNGPLSLMQLYHIGSQICDGLEAAHRQGIIHRDLKSQNIIINNANQIKIIDFGLARTTYGEGLTATGLIMGTPEYMSPEQVAGQKADERADIYSFGIILYEMITGRVPFTGESAIAVGFKQLKEPPPPPREINPQIPDQIEAIILKALEKDPIRRFHSIAELREELERAVSRGSSQATSHVKREQQKEHDVQ